jgi:hypothetical protein
MGEVSSRFSQTATATADESASAQPSEIFLLKEAGGMCRIQTGFEIHKSLSPDRRVTGLAWGEGRQPKSLQAFSYGSTCKLALCRSSLAITVNLRSSCYPDYVDSYLNEREITARPLILAVEAVSDCLSSSYSLVL